MEIQEAISLVCELARTHIDPAAVRRAKERQAAVLAWEEPDYLPMSFGMPVPAMDALPYYDWAQQWDDPRKSFVEQMKGVIWMGATGADAVPEMRADLGVVCAPSLFGVGFVAPAHMKPMVNQFIAKDTLRDFVLPEDIRALGVMPRLIEHTAHHLALLREQGLTEVVGFHHCDTQGPFDIACQVLGHDIFTEVYDDPDFVHQLMAQTTQAYIRLSRLCKALQGEGEVGGNASGYWMKRGGVRACDDSGILLPARLFEEFNLPYMAQAITAFDGGWIHYCGGVPGGGRAEGIHLHDLYLKIPRLCGFNFTTGKDLDAEIRKVLAQRIAYIGLTARGEQESLADYFRHALALCPGRKGLILNAEIRGDEYGEALDMWHSLQDEMFK